MSETLRVNISNNNITISDSVVDALGNAVTTGQTVEFNIKRLSDAMWWGGAAFDSVSEPVTPLTAAQVATQGQYEHTLTAGYDGTSLDYYVRHILTGTQAKNYYDTEIIGNAVGTNINSILGTILTESSSGRLAGNFQQFWNNSDSSTTAIVDDVLGAGGDITSILGTPIVESTAGRIAKNWDFFYDNGNVQTVNTIDTIGVSAGDVWEELRASHTTAGTFGEQVNADLIKIEGSTVVDTLTLTAMFTNLISGIQGDVVRSGNTYTYKKKDGTTTTFAYTVSSGGRT